MEPPPERWHGLVGGDPLAAVYLWYGISGATRASYGAAVDGYVRFRRARGLPGPAFPASANNVEAWVAAEGARLASHGGGLGKKALKRKLGALASWHTDLGFPAQFVTPRLERVITGVNRYHGVATRPQPLPITLPVLRRVVGRVRRYPWAYGGPLDHLGVVAAFTLMFACFMRMGEVTYDKFDRRFDLCRGSVQSSDDMKITIPASKTDPFRVGVTLAVPRGPSDICPDTAMRHWLAASPGSDDSPLFTWRTGSMTRATLEGLLRKALSDEGFAGPRFTGHSFRRGAATWAASIGMSPDEIKTLGRWNSDCFRLYVDAGPTKTSLVGGKMLCAPVSQSTLPSDGIPAPGDVWRPSL